MQRIETRRVRLSDISPCEDNPRKISNASMRALKESISEFGYVEPIIWNERTNNIVGGHQRYKALLDNNVKEITVVVVRFDEETEMVANITLNNNNISGDWDESAIGLISEVEFTNNELFKSLRFDELRDSLDLQISQAPIGEEDHIEFKESPDTKCPCCGHRWNVSMEDIEVDK